MEIYVKCNRKDFGPYSLEQLRELVEEGTFLPHDSATLGKSGEWTMVKKIPGFKVEGKSAVETVALTELSCPYCRGHVTASELRACPTCRSPHHEECWHENGGCTVYGCPEAPSDGEPIRIGAAELRPNDQEEPIIQVGLGTSTVVKKGNSPLPWIVAGIAVVVASVIVVVSLYLTGRQNEEIVRVEANPPSRMSGGEDAVEGFQRPPSPAPKKNWRDLHRVRFGDQPTLVATLQRKRDTMVEQLKAEDSFSYAVLKAMSAIPMELFCPDDQVNFVYGDRPVFIGFDETISQPSLTAGMLTILDVSRGDKVLELKTASGYQAALLAYMGAEVYSLETDHALGQVKSPTLNHLGFDNLHYVVGGDAYAGLPQQGPYDKIIATAAYPTTPLALFRQLKPGGRLIAPVGALTGGQYLMVYAKTLEGEINDFKLLPVAFGLMPRGNTARSP